MRIFVGSTNPVKVNAVVLAATETYPEVIVRGVDVPSGVSEQPMSDAQTRLGATNRAQAALQAGLRTQGGGLFQVVHPHQAVEGSGASLAQGDTQKLTQVVGIGLEGGVFVDEHGDLWSTVWVAVADQSGNIFESCGARFKVPEVVAALILAGGEMGPVMDELLGTDNIKQSGGMISVITRGFVDRTEEYTGIAKMALGLWYGQDWEEQLPE